MVDFSFLFLLVFSISSSLYRSNEGLMIWIMTGFRLIIIKIHDLLPPLKSSLTTDSQKHGASQDKGEKKKGGKIYKLNSIYFSFFSGHSL
jgi:hypothetical protein